MLKVDVALLNYYWNNSSVLCKEALKASPQLLEIHSNLK